MDTGMLGRVYKDGEVIIQQGESGDCMFVIQEGNAEVYHSEGDKELLLAVMGSEDIFGEMALFEKSVRSATVRAKGDVRVLTVDKKTFLRRIQEDPSMAFRILENMSHRIRELNTELTREKTS